MGFYGVLCPSCGSPDVKRRLNVTNFCRVVIHAIAVVIILAVAYVTDILGPEFRLPLKWAQRCRRCGTRFNMATDDRTRPKSAPVGCRECGYSLIGCTSDKCPECDAAIPQSSKLTNSPKRQ